MTQPESQTENSQATESEPDTAVQESSAKPVGDPSKPAWWNCAYELERNDRLKEAEELLRQSIPHQSFAYEIATLYRSRMIRLKDAGDAQRSVEARQKAEEWIHFYAAQATSGGEGAALSLERDEFLSRL